MTSEPQRRAWREQKRQQRIRKGAAIADLGALIDAGNRPDRPDRETLLRALGVRAREGSVAACRLLLEEYRRDGDVRPPGSTIDELSRRRR